MNTLKISSYPTAIHCVINLIEPFFFVSTIAELMKNDKQILEGYFLFMIN